MKKIILFVLTALVIVGAQSLGSRYLWTDKVSVSAVAVDSTFQTRWEFVTIYSDTLDLWLKIGAPDTSGWSQRDFIKLGAGTSLSFEAPMYLKRLEFKTVTGSGYIYMIGGKKVVQYH